MRHISREALKAARSRTNGTMEFIRVSTSAPFDNWNYLFTTTNRSVIFAGNVYTPLGVSRGEAQMDSNYSFDRISITADNTNRFWSRLLGQAIISGVRVEVVKAFFSALENERDGVTIFDGFIGAPSFTPQTFSFEIRSVLAYHDTELPPRTYQPGCNEFLGSARCGVDMTEYINSRSVTAEQGSTKRRINAGSTIGDLNPHHWDQGYVVALDGPERNIVRPIDWSDDQGRVHLAVPFNQDITGSRILIRRGCRKTKGDCDGRHGNLDNFTGFAEVPKEPASIGQVVQS